MGSNTQLSSSFVLPLSCSGFAFLLKEILGLLFAGTLKFGSHVRVTYVFAFFSPLLVKLVVPWVDIQKLERTSNVFLTDTIRITTQNKERDFSMFLNLDEVFKIMEQLADVTLRRLLDNEVFDLDPDLQEPSQITKR